MMRMKNVRYIILVMLIMAMSFLLMTNKGQAAKVEEDLNFNYIKGYDGRDIKIPNGSSIKDQELRGVWISTVYNLDFPSKPGVSQEVFKKEYLELLDTLEEYNMNSVIFQVRPRLDAFYKSDINPWSEYLTGKEDKSPGWDPLKWIIDRTHERGMEFQAWFNPYRVTTNYDDKTSKEGQLAKLSDKNWAKRNPKHVFKYKGRLYLNPGNPEVIDYINESIMEVVYNYDIDGVHLDDYFYPTLSDKDVENFYGAEEKVSYEKYGGGYEKISDWRRANIDKMIFTLNESIKKYNNNNKARVQFGVSPFGIWGHSVNHPEGSETPKGSQSSYVNHFADTKKWVENEWIDYIVPQIYWRFEEKAAPYGKLVDWWADTVKDTNVNLYIGHALHKKLKVDGSWKNPREISNQLKYNDNHEQVNGSVYFRYKCFLKDKEANTIRNQFLDILKDEHYPTKAKLPLMFINEESDLREPYGLTVEEGLVGNTILWKDYMDNKSSYYVIYREEVGNGKEREIVDLIPRVEGKNYISYTDRGALPNKRYTYFISSMTNGGYESELVEQ